MARLLPATLLALISLAPFGGGSSGRTALAQDSLSNGDVREVRVSLPPGSRVEHFRLDLPLEGAGDSGATSAATRPIGLVRWISGPETITDGTAGPSGWSVSYEVTLFEEQTRVLHTERLSPSRRELVFRELRAHSGRTLRFVWTPDAKGVSTETVGGEILRRDFDLSGGAGLPLAMVEVARREADLDGDEWGSEVRVFQPLAGDLEEMVPNVSTPAGMPDTRDFELRRRDGVSAGSYRFRGESLVSFRWQDGGPVASAIAPDEYLRRLAEREPPARGGS